jgi:hypothetical protein
MSRPALRPRALSAALGNLFAVAENYPDLKASDLVPNLVESVKGYAAHERTVLEQVTELRNRAPHELDVDAAPGLVRHLASAHQTVEDDDRINNERRDDSQDDPEQHGSWSLRRIGRFDYSFLWLPSQSDRLPERLQVQKNTSCSWRP